MRKLSKLTINLNKVIKNEELVNLRGGYNWSSSSCGAKSSTGTVLCGLSKTEALFWAGCNDSGTNCSGNWCCDSCSSSSYC